MRSSQQPSDAKVPDVGTWTLFVTSMKSVPQPAYISTLVKIVSFKCLPSLWRKLSYFSSTHVWMMIL
ncbi:hypothetical protein EB796_021211 [Bugula neritina]|uniref:Uncharacterized protein n=1 Tax=Bugula neritina TaxID=10212 RepID=A0A7J7J448_BUGNE|nr:hypothetical protein EB796_021211 [Bugula neritina]